MTQGNVAEEKIAEGKTKIIWPSFTKDVVIIESKDDITAGDGARRDIIPDKGKLANETTCNCFMLLNEAGIPTHFLVKESERKFVAELVKMIPVELVVRRIATGSYLKRHPDVVEGTVFPSLKFEPFYKDDARHDPLMVWNRHTTRFDLYDPRFSVTDESYLDSLPRGLISCPKRKLFDNFEMAELAIIAYKVFAILEKAWANQNVALVDLKIECGWNLKGELVVADVIDNDSWRIWPAGDKSQMKDKQVYRNLAQTTSDALGKIKENYAWVAEATRKFI
jgi:phosphoribosylaminoimidazole-succinocarboxamide synthase